MDSLFVLRLVSPAGFSRIEVPKNGTLHDIKTAISGTVNVHIKEQKIFYDMQNKKPINFPDSTPISKLGLKEGEAIFLSNPNAELNLVTEKTAQDHKPKCSHSERETCINCIDYKKEKKEVKVQETKSEQDKYREKAGLTSKCVHDIGQKCLYCMSTPAYKGELKYNCQHGENGKCPNCVGKEFIADVKHKSFDQFLSEGREKCKGIHEEGGKCNNCIPPQEVEYKQKKNCPNHPPYPEGCCNKCMPPNAILKRQPYRHVDYVSFMNGEELNEFVNIWMKGYCMKQRMGFLFGYYASDPNYPDGVRAVVEAIYEPPQLGDINSVEPMEDPDRKLVDKVAAALTFECVGWIFTSINTEKDVCLTSYDVRKAARFQQEYLSVHPSGYKVSKFITVVVKPKENNESELECYMVSDLCQALERDGLFEDSKSKKEMQVRKPNKNEMISSIYMENRTVENFDPDFFIVNLSHGAPVDKKDMNILKSYDFPHITRTDKGIVTETMIKDYFKKHKKDKPLVKYANFYFLIYLAKVLDIGVS
jgi:nuclear protein localization family protein 4